MAFLKKLFQMLISKKKIIAWVSVPVLMAIAMSTQMSYEDVKKAICEAESPTEEIKAELPQGD